MQCFRGTEGVEELHCRLFQNSTNGSLGNLSVPSIAGSITGVGGLSTKLSSPGIGRSPL
jgi:hypothetical protein